MEFYLPTSNGEWIAWISALVTFIYGVLNFFMPGIMLKLLRLQTHPDHPQAVAAMRSGFAGFPLGLGLCSLLFAQPFLWIALGACWAFTVFGRLISMLSDRGNTVYNWFMVIIEMALAAAPLAFAFGFIS